MIEPNEILSADDPRLTAYALGELDGVEREVVEAAVRNDPLLQAAVAEIRSFAGELAQTLEAEDAALAKFSPAPQTNALEAEVPGNEETPLRGKLLRFPALYYVFATAAAAGFAVMVALHPSAESPFRAIQAPMQVHFSDEAPHESEEGLGAAAAPAASMAEVAERKTEVPQRPVMPEVAKRVPVLQNRLPVDVAADLAAASHRQAPENGFVDSKDRPVSTFSMNVETTGYLNVRRFLNQGKLPPRDAARIEELLNYFPYSYPPPSRKESAENAPAFAADLEVAAAPWAPEHRLVRVALKGRELSAGERAPASLVFLIDVSNSMNAPDKLPLVKDSLRELLGRLRDDDRLAIVTHAGEAGLVLPATPVRDRERILAALEALVPVGAASGSTGIELAYDIAKANRAGPGLTRVILCTDGGTDAGILSGREEVRLIEENARNGVFLTALGFGMDSHQEAMLEQLAARGKGTHGYAGSRREAERLMVEQVGDALAPIAKDVRIRIEFNPAHAVQYRLIGYENRADEPHRLANGAAAAEVVGSGHSVTALYEVIPPDAADAGTTSSTQFAHGGQTRRIQNSDTPTVLLTVLVGYKEPTGDVSRELQFSLSDGGQAFEAASPDFQFAAAVAAFGMVLQESPLRGGASYAAVSDWGLRGAVRDPGGYRAEFLDLVQRAQHLAR